jgi:hypothetical protein
MDIEKLIKVLGMTTSIHDGEALAALRTAQRMMAAAKVTWADIVIQPSTPNTDPYGNRYRPNAPAQQSDFAHSEMFAKMYEQMRNQQSKSYKATEDQYSDSVFEAIFGRKRGR